MPKSEEKEHIFVRWRKSVSSYLKVRLEFMDVKIMSFVLGIVLMISVIAATVAWFRITTIIEVKGLSFMSSGTCDIEASIQGDKAVWDNILEPHESGKLHGFDEASASIDIYMPAFQNIYDKDGKLITEKNAGILAPGTYGSFSFYVKSVVEGFNGCELSIAKVLDKVATTEELSDEITQLFNGHILCFAKVEGEEYQYISEDVPIEIMFEEFEDESEPRLVTICWVWPYEYKDMTASSVVVNGALSVGTKEDPINIFSLPEELPECLGMFDGDDAVDGAYLSANQVFEWERYNESVSAYLETSDDETKAEWLSDWYDYADTLIGSYVEQMFFHIEVRGVAEDGK